MKHANTDMTNTGYTREAEELKTEHTTTTAQESELQEKAAVTGLEQADTAKHDVIEAEPVTAEEKIDADTARPILSEEEAKALKPILKRFMESYAKKPADLSDEAWLNGKLQEELPEKSPEEIQTMSKEIIEGVQTFDTNLASVNEACDCGKTKEEWFRDKCQEAAVGMSVQDYGEYLRSVDLALFRGETDIWAAMHNTETGALNMNPNADGFIAEQQAAATFNAEATLKNSPYRAEVLQPNGTRYGKNSVDIVIRDIRKDTHNIIRRYQMKFGQDADATVQYIKNGDYRGQRIVVPKGQAEAVKAKLSTDRNVTEYIESPDGVRSHPLSKEEAKAIQKEIRETNDLSYSSWNSFNTRELALQIGKQAAFTGVAAATIGTGFHLAAKYMQGEKIDGEEVVETALTTGADAGIKAAATGALKVGVEKGMLPVLRGVTNNGLVAVACTGIESAKILGKYATGEISGMEAVEKIGRVAVSTWYGLSWGAKGALIGAAALSWIPIVGPIVGGFVGGTIGYMAGSKVGETIYEGAKKIGSVVKSAAKTLGNGAKSICSGVSSVIKSLLPW